mgnify:CR=1 FL=1
MIHNIFEIPVDNNKLSLDNRAIRSYCLSLAKKNKGRVMTNSGGWQSNDLPKNEEVLMPFYENITYYANEFVKRLEFNGVAKLSNVWVNINGYKDNNNTQHQILYFLIIFVICKISLNETVL